MPTDLFDFVGRWSARAPPAADAAGVHAHAQQQTATLLVPHVLPTAENAHASLERCLERLAALALDLSDDEACARTDCAAPGVTASAIVQAHTPRPLLPPDSRSAGSADRASAPPPSPPRPRGRTGAPRAGGGAGGGGAGGGGADFAAGRRFIDVAAPDGGGASRGGTGRSSHRQTPRPGFARGMQAAVGALASSMAGRGAISVTSAAADAGVGAADERGPPIAGLRVRSEDASSDMAADEGGGNGSADELDELCSSDDELSLGSTASDDDDDE